MSQVLYRKYRPQILDELIGQPHITQTLKNAFAQNLFAQAYFLTGPKGTGKTSTARIIAKAANCTSKAKIKPCGKCDNCHEISEGSALDLIEIDAASNRGIEEIRDLREKVNFLPVAGRFKVYIIDEIHMLTPEAFNALLKTLEEPPSHIIFILCTTEPQKVPQTIISRCQRFDFKRATIADLILRLKQIAKSEKLEIADEALRLIAQNASGGFRDAETLLDQVIAHVKDGKNQKVELEKIQEILGVTDDQALSQLVDYLVARDTRLAILHLNKISDLGFNMLQFTRNLLEYLRALLLIANNVGEDLVEVTAEQYDVMQRQAENLDHQFLVKIIEAFSEAENDLKNVQIAQLPLELAAIKITQTQTSPTSSDEGFSPKSSETSGRHPKEEAKGNLADIKGQNQSSRAQMVKNVAATDKPIQKLQSEAAKSYQYQKIMDLAEVVNKWPEVLRAVKSHNHSIEACLKATRPKAIENNFLILEVFYPFHKERIEDKKHRDIIESVFAETFKVKLYLKCELSAKEKAKDEKTQGMIKTAQEILNGKMIE